MSTIIESHDRPSAALPPIPSAQDEVWYTRCPVPTPFALALQTGALADEVTGAGLKWRALQESSDPATHSSHFTHLKQNSFRHGGNIPAIWARARGADTRLVGLTWVELSYVVLALPGSGIESAADLRGRRLLVPRQSDAGLDFWQASVLRTYETALASASLTLDDVTLVEQSTARPTFADRALASEEPLGSWALYGHYGFQQGTLLPLLRGEVDAIASQGNHALELAGLSGAQVVFDLRDLADSKLRVNNDTPDTLTVSGSFAAQHPDRVALVIVQLQKAAAGAAARPDEATRLFARDVAIAEALAAAALPTDFAAGLEVSLDAARLEGLQGQVDFLSRHGFIERAFDVEGWVDRRPLELAAGITSEERA